MLFRSDINNVLVAPDPGAVMAHQVGEAADVVVVHVAGHGHVHGLHAVGAAQVVDGVLDEADAVDRVGGD